VNCDRPRIEHLGLIWVSKGISFGTTKTGRHFSVADEFLSSMANAIPLRINLMPSSVTES
jgi:hypothetical protein